MAQQQHSEYVIVVDPYSSGKYLVKELENQGEKIVAVRTNLDMCDALIGSFDPDRYYGVYCCDNILEEFDASKIADELEKQYGKPKAVFAGSEPAVFLVDQLQHHWGFSCNDPHTSEIRRNKAIAQDALRDAGVRAIHQCFSGDLDELLRFRRENLEFPVVVKPAMSGGTDGVYFCNSDEQVKDAFYENFGHRDILGHTNDKVILQEFLQGLEYVVDCVSRDGQHAIAALWVYKKDKHEGGGIVYDTTEFLTPHGEIQDQLVEYICGKGGVLDTLGVKHGPSHSEVMMTPTGPCLVECNPRMHGCDGPETGRLCTGAGQHNLYADILLNGKLFEDRLAQDRYTLEKHSVALSLVNAEKSGVLARSVDCEELRAVCCKSLISIAALGAGDVIEITRDLVTSPGEVLLVHSDADVIWQECKQIRELEASGNLYYVHDKAGTQTPETASSASPYITSP